VVSKPLWQPTEEKIQKTVVFDFIKKVEVDWNITLSNTDALWEFSIQEMEKFWKSLVSYADLKGQTWEGPIIVNANKLPGAKWFPNAKFNIAENMLRKQDNKDAIVFWGEDKVKVRMSFKALYDQVSIMVQVLKNLNIQNGDVICGYIPNMPQAIITTLAAASIGAIWSSCSPDFGVQGVLDRFKQVKPKLLFAADGYYYNGEKHDSLEKIVQISKKLPTLKKIIIFNYTTKNANISRIPKSISWDAVMSLYSANTINFEQLPFDQPLYVMFSSGTTGAPKCIVHSAGGTLLKHLSEEILHCNIKPGDRFLFFTTCGWMMWNWLITNLAWGATLLLYDGSPFFPSPNILFDYLEAENATIFGTSAKFIDALKKSEVRPINSHKLYKLNRLCSTGSPLSPEGFDFVYEAIKKDLQLISFTGGTDIMGCFIGGDPTKPVWRGELQQPIFGMDVDIFDVAGNSLHKQKGELVCKRTFPAVPLGFLNDKNGKQFHDAYFNIYPNIWCHGDFVEKTDHNGYIMHGRSDTTLNPGGVRIGTAEIYRQVEKLYEIQESIAIGQNWGNDVRIILFVILKPPLQLNDSIITLIKQQIRKNCSPRHVPSKIIQVSDIPRTKSGKITELAVRDLVHGLTIKNIEALANPEALEQYKNIPELKNSCLSRHTEKTDAIA